MQHTKRRVSAAAGARACVRVSESERRTGAPAASKASDAATQSGDHRVNVFCVLRSREATACA